MKTAKERLFSVDYATEILGDVLTKELQNSSEYERGYGVLQALELCETEEQYNVLDEVLTAFCGHGIEYLTNLVECSC